jgi:carboxypeptidase C (cathepsin A)
MKTSIKLTLAILSFGFLFLVSSATLYAQVEEKSNDEMVKSMTDNLKQKILLSNEQAVSVKAILSEYVSNKNATNEDLKTAQQKVENLLDNKQKMKYNILKNEWWKNLKPVSKE